MILWTIQPEIVYKQIMETGVYRCNPNLIHNMDFYKPAYDWLVGEMKERIGPPPHGVEYPVWAYHTYYDKRKKPDLRGLRWCWGSPENVGNKHVCLTIDIPDDKVVLLDDESWTIVLNQQAIADSEEEFDKYNEYLYSLDDSAKREFLQNNWKRVFRIDRIENDWMRCGETIQAVFWELRADQIKKVKFFTTAVKLRR